MLHDRQWIDDATVTVELFIPLFNPQIGAYSGTEILFQFGRGGKIQTSLWTRAFLGAPYAEHWVYFLDALWILLTFYVAISEVREMYKAKQDSEDGCKEYWGSIWNWIDWIQVILTLTLSVYFFFYHFQCSKTIGRIFRGKCHRLP